MVMGKGDGGRALGVLFCLLVLVGAVQVEGHFKLNVPRVRLPYFESLSVNFTLKVDTPGCYSWSISRPDVVTLHPLTPGSSGDSSNELTQGDEKCSEEAIIRSIPRLTSCCPVSAIIFAEDVRTKETVRCDIIIDKISKIEILTTTKELHLEEAPSKFHILGYGSKGNELSTMEGVPFQWVLKASSSSASSGVDPGSIMRFVPFSESLYAASPALKSLEERRQQGDTVLLEGIKTGSAEVEVRVQDHLYQTLDSAKARIIVVASLLLEPGEVYVVPGTAIPLSLIQIKHGRKYPITLPSPVYDFSVHDTGIVKYDKGSSMVTALSVGVGLISVRDKNWVDELEEQSEALTSRIHVTLPKYLTLSVYPYKNWALVMGNTYEIQVDLFTENDKPIMLGDNIFVETVFDHKYFRVDFASPNGTYFVGVPIKMGSAYVSAQLTKMKDGNGKEVTLTNIPRAKSEMDILQNVAVNPKETVLPWDPNVEPKYDLRWNPSGGNGNYIWTSSNTSVLTVSSSATGRTLSLGSSNVTVATNVNPYMNAMAKVHVLPPTKMQILEHIVEAEIGTAIQVPLAFFTIRPHDPNMTLVPYSSCGLLPIKVDVEDASFFYDEKTHYPHLKPACRVLPVVGNALGSSKVTVTYQNDRDDIYFQDSLIVSTFKPLQTIEPEENDQIVLAVGSTKQIVFEGGPRPLLEEKTGFTRTLELNSSSEDGHVASYRALKSPGPRDDVYVYEILCVSLGEADAVFKIGNAKVTDQSQSIVRIKVVRIICSEPSTMYFKVETPLKTKCPVEGSSAQVTRVAVPNYEPTLVSVVVKDSKGRRFDNITSLKIEWGSSPEGMVGFGRKDWAETDGVAVPGSGREQIYTDTGKGLQVLRPTKVSGNVEVRGRVVGYRNDVLASYKIKERIFITTAKEELEELLEESDLEHSMELSLVSDVTLSPSPSVSLFNHPSSLALITINDGSGFFELENTRGLKDKLNITYFEANKTIAIRPLKEGTTKLYLKDLCLSTTRKETVIDVEVSGINRITVQSEDKIPLAPNTEHDEKFRERITVTLQDQNGKTLPSNILPLAGLFFKSDPEFLVEASDAYVEPSEKDSTGHIYFTIIGRKVGTTEVLFTALRGVIVSEVKKIQVYPPITLSPASLVLLPGNKVAVTGVGGPNNSDIIFSVEGTQKTNQFASVAQGPNSKSSPAAQGVVTALTLGNTKIIGQSVDPQTKKVYSETSIVVKVVALQSLSITTPLLTLYEDEKMPIWFEGIGRGLPEGENKISSSLIATAKPSLTNIEWIQSSMESAEIIKIFQGPYSSVGKDMRVQFHALSASNMTLFVKGYYGNVVIGSPRVTIDIRKYTVAGSSRSISEWEKSGTSDFFRIFKTFFQSAYYYLLLPLLFIGTALVCSIAYNTLYYGEGRTGKNDTALFITQTTPQSFNAGSPSFRSAGSTSYYKPSPGSGSQHTPSGDGQVHRRLYSRGEGGRPSPSSQTLSPR